MRSDRTFLLHLALVGFVLTSLLPGAPAAVAQEPAGSPSAPSASSAPGSGDRSASPAGGGAGSPADAESAALDPAVGEASDATAAGAAAESGPVPVPQPSDKALRYYRSGTWLWLFGIVWGIAVPGVILFTGLSARMRDLARRLGRYWYFTLVIYLVLFSVLTYLIGLPVDYLTDYARQHAYGLSHETLGKWLLDSLKSLLIGCIMGSLFLWIPYLLLRKSPRRWWFYSTLAAIPFIFFVTLIEPVWIDPLFNKFGPMKDKALEARILALADRAGIQGGRVYEVEKSLETETVNAYVNGFMATKRIVLWDTTIAKLQPDEVLFVMGHEMGHYVLGHVWKSILFFSLLVLITLYAAYRFSRWILARFGGRFGFDSLDDVASMPLFIVLIGVFSLVVTPVALTYTRWQEHEADRFGLEITQNNHAAATAFVKLMTENLGVPRPHPILVLWRASHPTLGDRIDFCNDYHPWTTGAPLKYGSLFKDGGATGPAERQHDGP
jgi:STE24 endopeptidase